MIPLVSIIIPCYNAEKWIDKCIDSALSQTYRPIEVIVIDDGSTDNSLAIIKKYGNKIRWVSYDNGGPSVARNRGIKLSRGKYIQFIDADDYISSAKVKEHLEFLETSNADIVYGDWCNQYHKADGSVELSDYKINELTDDMLYYTIAYNKIHSGSCLYKRECIEKILGFDESLRIAEDYDFFIRLALTEVKFSYQAGCHYFYRRYNAITTSEGQGIEFPKSVELVLNRVTLTLEEKGLLTSNYRHAIACHYFTVAKKYLMLKESIASDHCYKKCKSLSDNHHFEPDGDSQFEKIYRLFGWGITSKLLYLLNIITIDSVRTDNSI
jgi:glycosyltransferase involved in cell wall biosynthesis